ncbi:DNA cytosine methyltransferase [Mucilaginibacter sp. SMC90]|uniref:DNA cytosine methyltransferase n=1 Tax=Mucilaginibacter sp. SMC90 TaxID=2929803 RepID=UPI001FB387D8|nr:DNA cytosine methyltransferase [Mucilaginibacter sp. SMC90]UOE48505.1 DNA cytosine methyltransferase [Mucilaginibacter sp. SMC90]
MTDRFINPIFAKPISNVYLMSNTSKVIDLYSGVGGLSLGAVKANFDLIGAVEYEKRIIDSHSRNFPKSTHICKDVSSLNGRELSNLTQLGSDELCGLIGGPPCQGFSTIGKRNLDDHRNKLFDHFFRLASEIKPVFFMAENVPGILNEKYSEIRKNAFKTVESDYNLLEPIKINASEFGAATTRTRVFFIGVRRDISGAELIPEAITNLKTINSNFVKDALEGLPIKVSDSWTDYSSSWQKISFFDKHRYLNSLNLIIDGLGDDGAINRFLKDKEVSGCFGTKHAPAIAFRYANLKPGQQDSVSKSVKLRQDGYCPTLRAGTDSTKGSYQAVRPIHPTEARVITPREAARLQGFPDWFQFHETKWHSFRQIGNSVCPIAAEKVLTAVKESLSI